MKILLTGGGTGGHFYPILAIAKEINKIADEQGIVGLKLYFMSDDPYDAEELKRHGIIFLPMKTGKVRTYFSLLNFTDKFKTLFAIMRATGKLFLLYPDVVFGKGGYASFPAIAAARFLRIPVVIHESDIIPGRVNSWIARYAYRVAISYPEAAEYFPNKSRVALTGNPIREELLQAKPENCHEKLGLEKGLPTILVLGGSQGSERINEDFIDIVGKLVEKYQIIHQTGKNNYSWIRKRGEELLEENPHTDRYKPIAYLPVDALQMAVGAADLIISRAGSTIFEIAIWGKPSILIPLPIARGDHQKKNAYSYARTGATVVIEEPNLKPGLLNSVIEQIMSDKQQLTEMKEATKKFAHPDAAKKIAATLVELANEHEHEG